MRMYLFMYNALSVSFCSSLSYIYGCVTLCVCAYFCSQKYFLVNKNLYCEVVNNSNISFSVRMFSIVLLYLLLLPFVVNKVYHILCVFPCAVSCVLIDDHNAIITFKFLHIAFLCYNNINTVQICLSF